MAFIDISMKQLMYDLQVAADLLNIVKNNGDPVITPENLREIDPNVECLLEIGQKERGLPRCRDKAMLLKEPNKSPVIVGFENQSKIDYTMTTRNMVNEGLVYQRYITIHRNHYERHSSIPGMTADEFVSMMMQITKIPASYTLVFYTGEEKWTYPLDIYGIIKLNNGDEKLVSNYRINLIAPYSIDDSVIEKLKSPIKLLIKLLKYRNDKDKLREILHSKDTEHVLPTVYKLAVLLIGKRKMLRSLKKYENTKTGEINMCKAFDDLLAEEKATGKVEGEKLGKDKILVSVISNCVGLNYSLKTIMDITKCSAKKIREIALANNIML